MAVSKTSLAWRSWALVGLAMLGFVLLGEGGSHASAASPYILDPELSLSGGCTPTPRDPMPDPECPGPNHPPKAFKSPRSVTTDFYGNIYVASYGKEAENGKEGRIDVFSPQGKFILEMAEPEGPKDLAVDSEGNLYVYNHHSGGGAELRRYMPSVYEPLAEKLAYEKAPVLITTATFLNSIAITPSNGHLYLKRGARIVEYGSAAEENKLLDETIGEGSLSGQAGLGLAIDEAHGRIYAGNNGANVRIFELNAPHALLDTVEPSEISSEKLNGSLAADESTGNFFIFDGEVKKKAYEFKYDETTQEAKYSSTLEFEGIDAQFEPIFGSEIGVDNGPFSPNSGFASEMERGYAFVPSEESGIGQSLAFAPLDEAPPVIEATSFANVTQVDAELKATINPEGAETHFTFEYTTQEEFEAKGFAEAAVAGAGDLSGELGGASVSAVADGLSPETEYRFRVVAENNLGMDEAEGGFSTYQEPGLPPSCPNNVTRTGPSALLPDCRAYELVTPADTNARAPRGIGKTAGIYFATREASPDGNRVSFITEGGMLPGQEGTGSLSGDAYLSARSENGWGTTAAGPNGVEAVSPLVGSTSPDQRYSFWNSNSEGSAAIGGKSTSYVRYPDGHSEIVGRGSVANDPGAQAMLISEDGGHIVYASALQLEENAPPSGTLAIYDYTVDEVTNLVSLLPGDVVPTAGQNAAYQGASLDGRGIAFSIGKKLYLRVDNEETLEVGENVTFAGVAEGGGRIFYLEGGDLFALDADNSEPIQFTDVGDVTPVNVATDGSAAYFVSSTVISTPPNPNGASPQAGKDNLYLSREGEILFVGTVTERDVNGEKGATEISGGLGLWVTAVGLSEFGGPGRFAEDPSRTTPDGNVLLFESRANLADGDSGEFAQIYRYDSLGGSLECLSCGPTKAPATSDASLQSILQEQGGPEPFNSFALVNNLRPDGRRAFFQSAEALVADDTDELQDVYEWEAEGVGSCERSSGCIYLISSGHSDRNDYLYAVSDSGSDVFFRTSDLLVGSDTDSTPSIYDARVGGGFPESLEEPCQGEGCRPGFTSPPPLSSPESRIHEPETAPQPKKGCPKGKRKVKKNGKVRCVKKKSGKHRRHKAGSNRRAGK